MTPRHLRRMLIVGGLALLFALPSAAQVRRPRGAQRAHGTAAVAAPLSAETIASLAKVAAVNLPWFDDIESGAPGWTKTGYWHTPYKPQQMSVLSPTINPNLVTLPDNGSLPAPNSGNYCWWYGENSTGTFIGSDFDRTQSLLSGGESMAPDSGSLITPPINLAGQTNAVLSFYTWWEIEGVESNNFDLMHVLVSTDNGSSWQDLGRGLLNPLSDPSGEDWKPYSSNGLGQKGSWKLQYFDLTPFVGHVVFIRFFFETVDDLYNGFRGWFIDDIGVSPGTLSPPVIAAVIPRVINPTVTPVESIVGAGFVSGATIAVDGQQVSGGVLDYALAQFDPSGLAAGTHTVRITNPDGQSATALRSFTVTSATPPLFSAVTPDSSAAGIAANLTITGDHFKPGLAVSIGGVDLPGPKLIDSTTVQVVSPTTLPVGIYNIVVTNPDSLSDLGLLAFRVTPFVYVLGDSLTGKAQPLQLAPVSPLFTSGWLHYRIAGKAAYDSTKLVDSAGQFTASLPASAITIRGVEFYLSLASLQGLSLTFPLVNPATAPAFLPVRSPKIIPPALAVAAKYRMISSPAVLDNPFVLDQLADDYGPYNPATWRVFRWVRNSYRELVPYVGMTLDPGSAYWLITSTGTPPSLKRAVSTPSDQPYYVPTDTGWNQIADPFAFSVAWSQVGGSSYMGKPYYYDGTQYMTVATLTPFEGYFVYNSIGETMTLAFPPVESVGTAVPKVSATAAPGPGEYLLQVSAALAGTDFRDTYNYVGFRNGSTPGRDALDALKPPPIGNGLQVNIIDGGSAYLENYKPAGSEGASWVFAVTSTGAKGKAVLTLGGAGTLPPGYSVHVLDLVSENAVPSMPGSFDVNLDAPNAPRYYKVIIGTESFAAKESQGIPLQPVTYALEQNYPNPFNPSTTIRYALAKKTDVTLEVFNTLGQRVRTLVEAAQTTGQYAVTWDGTSDGGAHVASGVYFYRLRTGEFTAVRKLAMIR